MDFKLAEVYSKPPNFLELAEYVPAFKPFVVISSKGTPTIDFQNPIALRALTVALLKRDFGIEIKLPTDRLCPMVPGRLEYVDWILQIALSAYQAEEGEILSGIDIGTGSSVIYPLLATKVVSSLRMIATDIDEGSLAFARINIDHNNLQGRIQLLAVQPNSLIFPPQIFEKFDHIDFTMCNPPFYGSETEVQDSSAIKVDDPFAVCTGSYSEMITPGGEVAFVLQILEESLSLGQRISLLGKLSSVGLIIANFRSKDITNFAIKETSSGYTKRWIIAWSFQDYRLADSIARSKSSSIAHYLPPSNTYHCFSSKSLDEVRKLVAAGLTEASLPSMVTASGTLEITAFHQTWSRTARRKQSREGKLNHDQGVDVNIIFSCLLEIALQDNDIVSVTAVHVQGLDRKIFAGFWSYLIRKINDPL